ALASAQSSSPGANTVVDSTVASSQLLTTGEDSLVQGSVRVRWEGERERGEGQRAAVENGGGDVIADHAAQIRLRQPAQLHRVAEDLGSRPGRPAVGGGYEADVEFAGGVETACVGQEVVGQRQPRIAASRDRIGTDTGDEVVDVAPYRIEGDTLHGRPGGAV